MQCTDLARKSTFTYSENSFHRLCQCSSFLQVLWQNILAPNSPKEIVSISTKERRPLSMSVKYIFLVSRSSTCPTCDQILSVAVLSLMLNCFYIFLLHLFLGLILFRIYQTLELSLSTSRQDSRNCKIQDTM